MIARELFTEFVIATRRSQRPRLRIIAIGRSAAGQPFQVIAPPVDFAAAVDEVLSRPAAVHEKVEHPRLSDEPGYGESTQPWLW